MKNELRPPQTRRKNKARILNYIFLHGRASKTDLAADLRLSMPTVLQNVKELTDAGFLAEAGNYQSTGGRKAKALSVAADCCYAVGVDITANHIGLVLVDAAGKILADTRLKKRYEDTFQYYQEIGGLIENFIQNNSGTAAHKDRITGIGVSIPGIIDKGSNLLVQSQVLDVSNVSLRKMSQFLPYTVKFDNDANCAAYTELSGSDTNAVYLSLNNTVGGAVSYHGKLYEGDNFKSGEFGHVIIVPNGKRCYCGKFGCLDCYCSALALSSNTDGSLEKYFEELDRGDPHIRKTWDEYLGYLALAVSNLRMAFDCDVIVGGYVGGYLKSHMMELSRLVMQNNKFDVDTSYLRCSGYHMEASAYGIARRLLQDYYEAVE